MFEVGAFKVVWISNLRTWAIAGRDSDKSKIVQTSIDGGDSWQPMPGLANIALANFTFRQAWGVGWGPVGGPQGTWVVCVGFIPNNIPSLYYSVDGGESFLPCQSDMTVPESVVWSHWYQKFIAVGTGTSPKGYASTDGRIFEPMAGFTTRDRFGIAINEQTGDVVTVGSSPQISHSPDLLNWTNYGSDWGGNSPAFSVTYSYLDGLFLAVGRQRGGGPSQALTSEDGISWEAFVSRGFQAALNIQAVAARESTACLYPGYVPGPSLSCAAAAGVPTLDTSTSTTISGNVSVSIVKLNNSATFTVQGTLSIASSSSLALEVTAARPESGDVIVPIVYESVVGTFSTLTLTYVSPSGCTETYALTPVYGSTSLSVTVGGLASTTCNASEQSSLSTGAIVGIAVGATVGGILLVLAIVFISRALLKRRDLQANRQIAAKNLNIQMV